MLQRPVQTDGILSQAMNEYDSNISQGTVIGFFSVAMIGYVAGLILCDIVLIATKMVNFFILFFSFYFHPFPSSVSLRIVFFLLHFARIQNPIFSILLFITKFFTKIVILPHVLHCISIVLE